MELSDVKANIEMEKTLLSALMIKGGVAIPQAAEILKPDDFYRPEHRLIYKALLKLSDENVPVDVLLVENQLEVQGDLKRVTHQYLFGIVPLEYSTGRVQHYAKIIKELSTLRQLIDIGNELVDEAQSERRPIDEIISTLDKKLTSAVSDGVQNMQGISESLVETYTQLRNRQNGGLPGLTTGFLSVDLTTGGLKKSDLIILAARPSMGKTALALNIAAAASKANVVAVFSLEMNKIQLMERLLSAHSQVEASRIQNGRLRDEDWEPLINALDTLSRRKLYTDDTPAISLSELKAKARRLKREHGLDLIVVDYIQLMQGSKNYQGNRVQEVSEISRGLKALARELNIPILALSQLSRSVEMRAEKKPQLSDLRESGSIEQDADIVMFLYREDYYERDTANENIAELIISKNRNGATGIVPLHFAKEYLLFHELTRRER